MASRFISPTFDAGSGITPSSGAKLSFFETGTSTPKDTFTTSAATVANANPVIADSTGVFPDIFLSGVYKVKLTDKNDVQTGFGETDPVGANETQNFDTVAALKLSRLSAGQLVQTIDYRSTQRGGGAPYLIKTTAQATTDGDIIDGDGNHTLANGNVAILQTGGVIIPRQFGATANGIANDTAVLLSCIAHIKANGGTLRAEAGDVFFLGTFADAGDDTRFDIDFDGFTFESNNCEFTAIASLDPGQAANTNQTVFRVIDASDVTFGDFKVTADAIDTTLTIGVVAMHVRSEAASDQNLNLGNITGQKLVATLRASSSDPVNFRYRRINAKKLFNNEGYYTVNFVNNGDDFKAHISSNNGVRSYFIYGVQGHDVKVYSTNHAKFTDVLIKRFGFDTKNINVLFDSTQDLSSDASISIEHQNDTDDGLIENVNIKVNVNKSNPANPTLNFVSLTNAGAIRATTESMTNNITVTGITNSSTPTVIGSDLAGKNKSRLKLAEGLLKGLRNYRRFIVIRGESVRLGISDDAGGMVMLFNTAELGNTPQWAKITVWGADAPSSSLAEYIIRQVWVLFSVASNGTVTVTASQVVDTFTAGALGPTITFPAGAIGSYNFSIAVNNYVNSNRRCRATLEIFSASI